MSRLVEQIKTTAEQLGQDVLPFDALKRLQQEIEDACILLDHAIAEGSQAVSDHLIAEIKKAQRFLHPNALPLWSDRAAFEKAYRELAQALCPISAEGVRATSPLQRMKEYSYLLIVLGVPFLAALFFLGSWVCSQWTQLGCAFCENQTFGILIMGVGGGLMVFFLWSLYVFTGVITNRKLNQIIFFCYTFTVLSLATSVMPFFTFSFFPELPSLMALSPISILRGCSEDPSTPPIIPQEIRCLDGKGAYQWIINIGGAVYPPPFPAGTLMTPSKQSQDLAYLLEQTHKMFPQFCVPCKPQDLTQLPGETRLQMIETVGAGERTVQSSQPCPENREGYWHIQGGLVVPLYVLVLSLMGGAVSMTRKVPEYQRRALDPKEPLTNTQAREYLVFQIMQVLSAPLIGVTVYYLYGPDTPAKSVFLGFAAGFASEPILLSIRGLVDKLRPAESVSSLVATGPISVTISPGEISLKEKEEVTFSATVTYVANPGVTWSMSPADANAGKIEQTGLATARYKAPDEITSARTVTITARSAAGPTKSGTATVKLNPPSNPENKPSPTP